MQQDAQLIARMRVQRIMMRQLAGDLRRQVRRQPALHIDLGQFGQFLAGIALERALLKPQVGRLGIGLRTHGYVFTGSHRQGTRHQAGQPRGQDGAMRGLRRRHPVIRLAVDTMPSFAPNTAARSQLLRKIR